MVPQLTYYDMGPHVIAFSTTRRGGCSEGSYATFNVNEYCGDDYDHIRRNRQALCCLLGIPSSNLNYPHQIHESQCKIITSDFLSMPLARQKEYLEGTDALVTNEKGVCVAVSTADCVPVLLYDSVLGVVSAVHSGWRGTVKKIVSEAIRLMQIEFGSQVFNLKAVIGPSISCAAYEVGDEVYESFSHCGFPMDTIAQNINGRWHLDLPAANRWLMLQCGLLSENISFSGICTYGNSNEYFSARKLSVHSGRILTGIMLRI